MEENYDIYTLLSIIELHLLINKPVEIQTLHLYLDFRDTEYDDHNTLRWGFITLYMETATHYTYKELWGACELYGESRTQEESEDLIICELEHIHNSELRERKYDNFWNTINLDNEEWKRKGE